MQNSSFFKWKSHHLLLVLAQCLPAPPDLGLQHNHNLSGALTYVLPANIA